MDRKSITLIGMSGAGKSYWGKKLAEKIGYRFLDVDAAIEDKLGSKLQEIIDDKGEREFLKIEEQAILSLGDLNGYVISPGGSVVYSGKAMAFLKKISKVIFLDCPFGEIKKTSPT